MKRSTIILWAIVICLSSCEKDDDIYTPGSAEGANISTIIKLDSKGVTEIPADMATAVTIYVSVPADAATANKTITLSTTLGVFVNGQTTSSVLADAHGNAEFTLRSSAVGTAVVLATSGSYSVNTSVKFVAAMPDDMILTSDKYQISSSETATLTATLYRTPLNGSVTDPAKVEFNVTGGTGNPLFIPAFAYSNQGIATAVLGNPFGSTGTYTITAKTTDQQGQPVSKSIIIVIR